VETNEELKNANDLMAKIHMADYFTALNWLETCGAGYPGFRREHTRIALWRGELAGSLRMNTETIRLGEARLKMGGFGWVTTAPRHRHKGICRALINDTLEYMRQNNYHVSMLFGIPDFYHRFAFTTTLADYGISVDLSETLAVTPVSLRVRDAKPGDIPAIQKIHNANDTDVACSLLRGSAHLTNRWERGKGIRVLTNSQGRVMAYFFANRESDHLRVTEVGIGEGVNCGEILGACARLAGAEALAKIKFLVPPPHMFARYLLRYRSMHEMQVFRDCGGMMTFVNIPETLESMIPEWECLLARSSLRDKRVEVTLVIGRTYLRIRANRGAIDIAQSMGTNKLGVSLDDLIHLVTGYSYLQDILLPRRRLLTEEARAFLGVIFPKRCPYVWPFDRF
jgi:predicted N-acetyltransferase YhbS